MLGVAIIGCGDMGTKHSAAWAARDDAKVVAVCDRNADRMAVLADRYGASTNDRWQDAIAQDGVDVVSVCVPACDHRNVTVLAASLGRHILCEKAMALTLEQADEMIDAARSNNVQLLICHQYRGLSRIRKMKELIAAGRIGWPVYIRAVEMREVRPKLAMHRLSGNGGPLHDMTGHIFDLARFLTGAEAESVTATGAVFGKGKPRLASVTDFGIDTAEIQVRFRGGHCLSIGIGWGLPEGTPGHCNELIHGPLGIMCTEDPDNPDRFLGDIAERAQIVIKDGSGVTRIDCEPDTDGPGICIDELVAGITSGARSQFDAVEGRAALRLISAALESVQTGRGVELA